MEWTQADTLGNQRRVERIPVDQFDGETGSASAKMIRRGSAIGFEATNAVSKLGGQTDNMVVGLLAEAVADSDRRKPRPGRPTTKFVMPITFEGVEIVSSPERIEDDIWAGDAVLFDSILNMLTTKPSASTYFVGVANVFAPRGSDLVQVRVDAFARCHDFDPSDTKLEKTMDQAKYNQLKKAFNDAAKTVTSTLATVREKKTKYQNAIGSGDATAIATAKKTFDTWVKKLQDSYESLKNAAKLAEQLVEASRQAITTDANITTANAETIINANPVPAAPAAAAAGGAAPST